MTESYKTQIASDIIRDGIGVELLDKSGEPVLEVFRNDSTNTVSVSTFGESVPLAAFCAAVTRFQAEFTKFEDGTPIPVFNL